MCNTCNHRHTNCCHTSPHHCCRCRPVLIVADRPEREESECKKKERTCRHCSCRPPVMIAPSSSQRPGRSSCHSESERSESERSGCSSCHSESERPEWSSCHPWPVWPCHPWHCGCRQQSCNDREQSRNNRAWPCGCRQQSDENREQSRCRCRGARM